MAMVQLTPDESRVLGVLIEKAQTTPGQYPMTLNAIVTGCNQKNNRHPVTNLDEERVMAALDSLRGKNLGRELFMSGSRVPKYRHTAREAMEVSTSELVVLAELLLRGPQTLGELRGRASRMHPLESLEIVKNVLNSLAQREQPMVRELAPLPGTRAERYAQLLCPTLHRLDEAGPSADAGESRIASPAPGAPRAGDDLERRIAKLEADVAAIRSVLESLAKAPAAASPMNPVD
jgi:uncharacterized protein YceH (UPF0502 family)